MDGLLDLLVCWTILEITPRFWSISKHQLTAQAIRSKCSRILCFSAWTMAVKRYWGAFYLMLDICIFTLNCNGRQFCHFSNRFVIYSMSIQRSTSEILIRFIDQWSDFKCGWSRGERMRWNWSSVHKNNMKKS